MLSYHGVSAEPESSTSSCLERVRQVAVLLNVKTTTVFGRVHHNAAQRAKSAIYDGLVVYCNYI